MRTMSPGTRLRLPIAAITLFLGKTTGHFSFQGNLEGLLEEMSEDSDTKVVAGELAATGAAELTWNFLLEEFKIGDEGTIIVGLEEVLTVEELLVELVPVTGKMFFIRVIGDT